MWGLDLTTESPLAGRALPPSRLTRHLLPWLFVILTAAMAAVTWRFYSAQKEAVERGAVLVDTEGRLLLGVTAVSLFLTAGALVLFLWRREQLNRFRGRCDSELAHPSLDGARSCQASFRQLAEGAPYGILMVEGQLILNANPEAVRMFGAATEADLAGHSLLERTGPEEHEALQQRVMEVAAGVSQAVERRYLRLNGEEFWAAVSAGEIEYNLRPAGLLFFRDVTAARRAGEEHSRLEEQLRQAQKMESVGRLARGVAHDLNNHLTVIHGYCEMLLAGSDAAGEMRESLEEIRAAGGRATALTQQLLAFSRNQIAAPRGLDPNPDTGRAEETLLVVEDQDEVRRLALSVLKANGYHLLQAGNAEQALELSAAHAGKIDLLVTDVIMPGLNGRQLAERLAQDRPGLKVLYTSGYSADVMALHGSLEPGMEYLPKPFGAAQLSAKVREVLGAARPRSSVLVIDDDPAVRGLLRKILTGAGYGVVEAGDGKIGMNQVERQVVDLAITDLVMPEQEGLETLQLLKVRRPGLPVIAISGAFGGSFLETARRFGAVAALPKPIDPETLLRVVREALAGAPTGAV